MKGFISNLTWPVQIYSIVTVHYMHICMHTLYSIVTVHYMHLCILTWILGVVSKQLRLLHDRVGDSTTLVDSLSPQLSELVEDAVASWCGDIGGHFWLIRNELQKLVELKFKFFIFNTFDVCLIFWQRVVQPRPKHSYCMLLEGLCWVSVCYGYWIVHCVPCLGCFLFFIVCPIVPSIFVTICCVTSKYI